MLRDKELSSKNDVGWSGMVPKMATGKDVGGWGVVRGCKKGHPWVYSDTVEARDGWRGLWRAWKAVVLYFPSVGELVVFLSDPPSSGREEGL